MHGCQLEECTGECCQLVHYAAWACTVLTCCIAAHLCKQRLAEAQARPEGVLSRGRQVEHARTLLVLTLWAQQLHTCCAALLWQGVIHTSIAGRPVSQVSEQVHVSSQQQHVSAACIA